MAFLHGAEVLEITDGARPIRTISTGVVGLVGSALRGPVNEPTLVAGSRARGADLFGADGGTIPDALDAIFAQIGAAVVVVNVLDPDTHKTVVAAAAMNFANGVVQLPHRLVSAVSVSIAGPPPVNYAEDVDYALDAEAGTITVIAGGGIVVANPVQVGYTHVDASKVAAADVVGAVGGGGDYTGVSALVGAASALGAAPKVLIAPGYSEAETVANALISAADRLRGAAVIEGPDTTDAAAIAYRGNFASRRAYVVDPGVRVSDANGDIVTRPNSAHVAGVIARSDAERGFWWSPSNRAIRGIVGTTRPVDFGLGDENSRANLLNADEVATIIRENGYRLWGNRTCSDDPKWQFLSVVRTADAINESILRTHLWAVDRNITRTYFEDVAEGVNGYLRDLKGLGAILGGECYPSPELNTPAKIADGRACFDVDFTPPPPAERLTFRSRINNNRIEEVLSL